MSTIQQTEFKLEKVRSHSVSLDHRGGKVHREEFYPILTAEIRGEVRRIEVEASRYTFADGDWSDWRIFARSYEPAAGIGEKTIAELRPEIDRFVRLWLDGTLGTAESGPDGRYGRSRARAFASMVRYQLRDTFYDPAEPARIVAAFRDELTVADDRRLSEAAELIGRVTELLG